MAGKTFGRAKITINGRFIDTFQGVTVNPGGIQRNLVKGTFSTGFNEEEKEAKLEFEVRVDQDTSMADLDLADATVQVAFDSGQTYVMNHAFRTEIPDFADTGKAKTTFMSGPATEIK